MSNHAKHNSARLAAAVSTAEQSITADSTPVAAEVIRHVYVHIPFCARLCPYCAFYKDLLDRSQTRQFCEAILGELERHQLHGQTGHDLSLHAPSTIYFGGGTPTALSIAQLEGLLRGFHERLDLSELVEWTVEANPGSVSRRKAAVLKTFGVNRNSLGVQSWDNDLFRVLGREHNADQADESFRILRAEGSTNINVDLMFGLPGQTADQWRASLEKTVALQPEHISTYCLTYEQDTEFFLRHVRGEFRQDPDADAEFFEMTMTTLENAGYEHYEISNYARPGFESVHNRAYWLGKDYLGIGPSAVSTIGMHRWQNVCDYRAYIDRVLSGRSPSASMENLTDEMKRTERIALSLRTRDGVSVSETTAFGEKTDEFIRLGLLQQSNGRFVLTPKGRALADSVAEAFL
jgi:oxygen-independent coproporphyrinogen-3 oxidase